MAVDLDLKAEWVDHETILVSWNNIQPNPWAAYSYGGAAAVVFAIFAGVGSHTNSALIGVMAVAAFLVIALALIWITPPLRKIFRHLFAASHSRPSEILFGKEVTTHGDTAMPTPEITRIEYGLKSQLTGSPPRKSHFPDPMIFRMWVRDSWAHDFGENNWEMQVNHEVRDALARALETVRQAEKQQDQDREFGPTSGDHGMPEY